MLHLSPIFKWLAGDFESETGSIMKFVTPFLPAADQSALAAGGFTIAYYDGALNDRFRP